MTQPWLERSDWKQGRLESKSAGSRIKRSRASIGGEAVFAIVFNALTWPSAYFLWKQFTDSGRTTLLDYVLEHPKEIPLLLIWLLFPTVSLVFAFRLAWRIVSAMRYGRSTLMLNVVPAPIGGQLSGAISAQGLILRDDQDVVLTLECRATQVRSKTMDETEMSQRVEWTTDRVLSRHEVSKSDGAVMLPVQLPIPPSSRQTGERIEFGGGNSDTFSWWLVARVEPGHGWNAEFEIPAFRTAETAAQEQNLTATTGTPTRPPSSRIVVYPASPEGVEIRYPAQVGWMVVVGLIWVATLPLYVTPWILFRQSGWAAAIGWLALALAINGGAGYMLIHDWPRRLVIGPEWVTVFYRLKRPRIPTSEAGKVDIQAQGLSIVRKGQTSLFKRWFFVTPRLSSDAEARWLGAEIERALAKYR